MASKKRIFTVVTLALLAVILSGLMASPALGQQPPRVKVLIGFAQQPGPAEQALVRRAGGKIKYTYHLVPAIAASVPEPAIDGLRRNPNVTIVELDGQVQAVDAELDNAWGVKRIGSGAVHDAGNTGDGVAIAIIDSGVDYSHPDLDGNYVGGWDFVDADNDPTDPTQDGPMDVYGHGTHVAGTACAEVNEFGVVGVAPGCALYSLRVLDGNGFGSFSDVIAAMEWAVDNGMQVANLSLGWDRRPGDTFKAAFDNAWLAGLVTVAAAGNNGDPPGKSNNVIYPAKYPSVIAVAATDAADEWADFSSVGDEVELAAPGVSVLSTWNDSDGYYDPQPVCLDNVCYYKKGSGTSMASPHVAGTAALIIASGTTNNDEVRQRLQETADDLGDPGRDPLYGFGLVDAHEAAMPTDTTPPAKVAGLSVAPAGCAQQLDLAWAANEEDDLHHYNVYRATTDGDPDSLIASPTANSYSDGGLTALATYHYAVSAVDTSGNEGEWSDVASGTTGEDPLGPTTANVVVDPSPTGGATLVTLAAEVSDSASCNSPIMAAEYFVDVVGAEAKAMSASDGAFDSATEEVVATIDVTELAVGQHTLYVRGQDEAGNWGAPASVVLDVTDSPGDPMYVESIVFSSKTAGRNKFLYTTVKVLADDGAPSGGVWVMMELTLDNNGDGTIDDSWDYAGETGSDGTVRFTLLKAPSGLYEATVTDLTLTGYTWDSAAGEISDTYEL